MIWMGMGGDMGGHRSMLMVMDWVWVQIRRKMLGSAMYTIKDQQTCTSNYYILPYTKVPFCSAGILKSTAVGATCHFPAGQTHDCTESSPGLLSLGSHSEWAPRIFAKSIGGFRRRISFKALVSSISAQLRSVIAREFGELERGWGIW